MDRDENLARVQVTTLAIIFLITVIGNFRVLLALWRRRRYAGRKKLSRMYFFILHLSIADLITAFLSVLPQLAWDITYRFYGGCPVFVILTLLYTLNSCVNPWIYLAFNRELPRLLLRYYTASGKNYRSATGGNNSPSNSSGEAQSTTLQPFSRWSLCHCSKSNKYSTRLPHLHRVT